MTRYIIPLVLALFWGVSGAAVGFSLQALFGVQWIVPCASLSIITGLMLLLLATRSETARRMLYDGLEAEGGILLAILWAIPVTLAFVAALWWLLSRFLGTQIEHGWAGQALLWLFPPALLMALWGRKLLKIARSGERGTLNL